MHALITWSSKNGVALGREELEVRSTSKLTVMNGGKMEAGATINMLFRKDIWGGTIQSLHDDKKDADDQLEKEMTGTNVRNAENVSENTGEDQGSSKTSQRKRKKKSYGKDFEENDDSEESDSSEENEKSESPVLKEANVPAKKTKKVTVSKSLGGKENEKKKRKSAVEKERELDVSAQHDELMITQILGDSQTKTVPPHPTLEANSPNNTHSQKEKDSLEQEILDIHDELNDTRRELEKAKEELRTLKALQPSNTATHVESVKYGKIPRSVGVAQNWEEISNGVWCCPIKVKAAVKDSATRSALALALFGIFYPKEELKGRRLQELDQDIIEAITDFSLIARLTKEPKPKKLKEGEEPKPSSPVSRSGIKQAMRVKCNSVICQKVKKAKKQAAEGTSD
ncbi:hypothetical protein OS493_033689 [Desmophyllum pertusum]|uniref:Uncharacterized protein n=1 Tax=Desmophyllum pertusum TaxID=174260 RepID=A0A9X0D1V1_9CNID|nr:hypothetical protein OS493_033689 [Desmophyllum pertusum]